MLDYANFLQHKAQSDSYGGFAALWMPEFLFDFQASLVDWALAKGKAAIFADCGLGKTPMQLVWAENVVRKTNLPVLVMTPLAVARQTILEAEKFDIEAHRSRGKLNGSGASIIVTNYEQLHHFDPKDFGGAVCDESSILKSFDGVRRQQITEFLRQVPYRLLCTATAAPNDYIELGTSSEALGELGHVDMLNRFFKNDRNTTDTKGRLFGGQMAWRFKGHAEHAFWRWVCSWARALRKPSDLGFSDDRFDLPPLDEREHVVRARVLADGALFALPAANMHEERDERRRTIQERCETAARLVQGHDRSVVWCHLNAEGDLLERIIPGARQIAGATPDDEKEEIYEAFAADDLSRIIIKPKIGAWGLNWQHCAHVVSFASHSYEQYYQAVRRCWRFGQEREVLVDIVCSEGETRVKENLQRKSAQADRMFTSLVAEMNNAMRIVRGAIYDTKLEVPPWL
jgi:hypothetical protein